MPETRAPYEEGTTTERPARIGRIAAKFEALMAEVGRAHAPEFLEVGVTMSQAKVLHVVEAMPDVLMTELAARLAVSLSTVSGIVDRLVDQGLLARRDDPADRRHVLLRITEVGSTQLDLMRELSGGRFRELLGSMGEADLATVERALEILAAAAGTERAESSSQATQHGGRSS